MTLDEWIDWLELDAEELHLDKDERIDLLELLKESKRYKEEAESFLDTFCDLKAVLAKQGI